jgi:glycosyltransferase involved in cell wall biosynthesis
MIPVVVGNQGNKMDSSNIFIQKEHMSYQHCELKQQLSGYSIDASLFTTFDPASNTISALVNALQHWEQCMGVRNTHLQKLFFQDVDWLVQHEILIGERAGGWPVILLNASSHTKDVCLSALVQGLGLSVFARAYRLTEEDRYLKIASRIAQTFALDILDGGVNAPIGAHGICFEEIATYPANHRFAGFICGILGLDEYVLMTDDPQAKDLVRRAHETLHRLLNEFDAGYWTRTELIQRDLTSWKQHSVYVELLQHFATSMDCDACASRANRWNQYRVDPLACSRMALQNGWSYCSRAIVKKFRAVVFPKSNDTDALKVGVPITAFPVSGGMGTIVRSMNQVMQDEWQIEYITQFVGSHHENYMIRRFGTKKTHPWQFPAIWLYCLAGGQNLVALLRRGAGYQLLLPQDGIYSAAFTAIISKLAGIRVVAMDHGNLTLLENKIYQSERLRAVTRTYQTQPLRLLAHVQLKLYQLSLRLLARFSARFVDHFLIPGVEGDEETQACTLLGIPVSRITRYSPMIDISHYDLLTRDEKERGRIQYGIAPDAIVIVMICRLSPEKGIDIVLKALGEILPQLPIDIRSRVRFILGGDGPLRKDLEMQVHERDLDQFVTFWGEISRPMVPELLSLSDISIYASWRGVGMPLSILEPMAAGCTVVATTEPLANAQMLADGRGLIVTSGNVEQLSEVLTRLVNDSELYYQMGQRAREYITINHSAVMMKRALLRVAYFKPSLGVKDIAQ